MLNQESEVVGPQDRETKRDRQIKRERWKQRAKVGVVLLFSTLRLGGGVGGRNRLCRKPLPEEVCF